MKKQTREFIYSAERIFRNVGDIQVSEIEYRYSSGVRSYNRDEVYNHNNSNEDLVNKILAMQESALNEDPDLLLFQVKIARRIPVTSGRLENQE